MSATAQKPQKAAEKKAEPKAAPKKKAAPRGKKLGKAGHSALLVTGASGKHVAIGPFTVDARRDAVAAALQGAVGTADDVMVAVVPLYYGQSPADVIASVR